MRLYVTISILLLFVVVVFFIPDATAQIQIDPASIYYNDSGSYVPYKLIDNSTALKVLTKDGSYILDKNSCSLVFHNDTNTNSSPKLKSDSWSVLASLGNSGVWNPVSIINNAACTTSVAENQGSITINATRNVSGAGSFTTQYVKKPQTSLELILYATNNNPSWTNYHIGGEEKIGVSRFISFGNQTYDLAQYNNTVLSRSWIQNHNAQFIQLASNVQFNLGNAWPYVSQIKIQNTNGNYYLVIDYTYNTPILSPGNTITVDPSLDTSTSDGTVGKASGQTASTQTLSFTVGTGHSNTILIVGIGTVQNINAPSTDPVSGVTYNGVAMTLGKRNTQYDAGTSQTKGSEFWYLVNPATGTHNIVITMTSTNVYSYMLGAYSLYNVNQVSPIGVTATNQGTTATPTVSITPTTTRSWILDVMKLSESSTGSFTGNSATKAWQYSSVNDAGGSQYNSSPTIGGSNTLSWSTTGMGTVYWVTTAIEVKNNPTPVAPTISKVNTLNSTAINATFNKPTGATFTLLNITLSGGATTHINTTNTQVVLNNYTAGSKYTFQAFSGNSSGISSGSVTKYNYTKQIAPTSPVSSSISSSGATVTVTPPSGNVTGGYNVYYASPSSGVFSLYGTTITSSKTLSGLSSNTQYAVKFASRYALGTNYSGLSSNSTVVSFYTLPNPPTGLAIGQTVVNVLHLTWIAPTGGNGTVLGYKIERSIDYGTSWLTIVSNTGNTATTYDDTGLTTGDTYTYRVSTIKYGGVSTPTSPVSATVLSSIQLNPTGSTFSSYNTTTISLGLSSNPRSSSTYDIFPTYSGSYNATTGKQAMSWYTGTSGSPTLTKRLGIGLTTLTLSCNLSNTFNTFPASNYTNIYYECGTGSINHINILTGINTHDFTTANTTGGVLKRSLFLSQHYILGIQRANGGFNSVYSSINGNTTAGSDLGNPSVTNQEINAGTSGFRFNYNTTTIQDVTSIATCGLNYSPSNTTTSIDSIACDYSIPAMSVRYWNGMLMHKVNNYAINDMRGFTSSIDTNPYKKILSLPCTLLGADNTSCTTFILTDTSTDTDYLIVLTATNVYYKQISTISGYFSTNSYAIQSYYITPYTTTSVFNLPSPLLQPLKLYGSNLNITVSKTGLLTIPSGYSIKGTSIESNIRTVDPRWTNDNTDIPLLTTTGSLYQIFVTVSNAPTNAAMMVTYPSATIDSIAGVWTVVVLDATHSTEFDIPANLCGLVYVADTSSLPTIWNYEGQLCATGVNQKTIAYVNTLPTNFYTLKYGVTSSYTSSTDGLTTTFHTTTPGTSYTVDIKDSNGTVAQTYTFTVPTNATIDTQHYNVSGVSKPAGLFVTVAGNQVYSAYLGSPFSLSSAASFFHQYLSYQGFDLLSFIPLIFASMFTRNTVGIGAAMTVVLIATLSFLSVVVIPETVIYVGIIVAVISMIGYRAYGY